MGAAMTERECPCCLGSGRITVVHAPRPNAKFVTTTALAARLGYSRATVTRHIQDGRLKADIGEIVVSYRRNGSVVDTPRPCYMIRKEDADAYAQEVLARRERGQRVSVGKGVEMLKMHEQGHSDEVIAERFGIKPTSARRTYLRAKQRNSP